MTNFTVKKRGFFGISHWHVPLAAHTAQFEFIFGIIFPYLREYHRRSAACHMYSTESMLDKHNLCYNPSLRHTSFRNLVYLQLCVSSLYSENFTTFRLKIRKLFTNL